jgi:hypothetical protein
MVESEVDVRYGDTISIVYTTRDKKSNFSTFTLSVDMLNDGTIFNPLNPNSRDKPRMAITRNP